MYCGDGMVFFFMLSNVDMSGIERVFYWNFVGGWMCVFDIKEN